MIVWPTWSRIRARPFPGTKLENRSKHALRSDYRLEIRPSALTDIAEAASWYHQKESGLGSEFEREVVEAIGALPNNPLMYRVRRTRKNVRWKLLDRFPYRIVFRITEDLVTVIAVLHSARNDRQWRQRL